MTTSLEALKRRLAKPIRFPGPLYSSVAAYSAALQAQAVPGTVRPSNVDPVPPPKRETRKVRLGPIKSEDWGTLSAYLGFDEAVEEAHFEYGEYATIEIELEMGGVLRAGLNIIRCRA